MIKRVAEAIERRPYLTLLAVLIVSGFMAYGVTKLSMTTEFDKFLPEECPSIKARLEFESEFGSVSYVPILIEGDNVTQAAAIHAILDLENSLQTDPKLQNFVIQVEVYTDYIIPLVLQMSGGVLPPDPQLEASVQSILLQPEITEKVVGKLITADHHAALLNVSIGGELPKDERAKVVNTLRDRVDNFNATNENLRARATGELILHEDIYGMMNQDNSVLIPAAILLVAIILFLVFKRPSDIFTPLMIVGLSSMWAVGTMGYLGLEFTMLHVALVPLLFGLGIDYSVHMLNRYYEELEQGKHVKKAILTSITTVGVAISITVITTMIGFGSFMTSSLAPIRTLGAFAALGILFTFVLALTCMPAVLVIRDRRGVKKIKAIVVRRGKKVDKVLSAAVIGAERHGKPIVLVAALVSVICAFSAVGISSTMSFETFLPESVESVVTLNEIRDQFGGQSIIFVLAGGDVMSPQGLREMLALENSVLSDENNFEQNLITGSSSLADAVLLAAGGQIPMDESLITTIIENLDPAMKTRLLSDNHKVAIYFFVDAKTDKEMEQATKIVRSNVEGHAGGVLDFSINGEPAVGGEPVIISDILGNITPSMVSSTVLTIVLCLVVLVLLFRSPVLGLIALLPLLLTLSWEFGTLRVLGWPLDVLTMGISALIIGLGVDYAVHVIHRFMEEKRKYGPQLQRAIRATSMSVGTAMLTATATTVGVFAVLSLSGMPAMGRFGTLTALVIFYAFVAALVILPSVLVIQALWKRK